MPAVALLDTRKLLAALTERAVRASSLAKQLGVSRATLARHMAVLVDEGLAVKDGNGPTSLYRLKNATERMAEGQVLDESETKVFMEMTPATARTVHQALELFARLGLGQFDPLMDMARMGQLKRADGTGPTLGQLEAADFYLRQFKSTLMDMGVGHSHGIRSQNVDKEVKTSWAVAKALRHRLAWDRTPQGSLGVWHDEPMSDDLVDGLKVHSGPTSCAPARMVDMSWLPPGLLMQFKGGKYRIVGPCEDGVGFKLYGESHSWQTASQKARNVLAGKRPVSLDF